MAGSSLVIVRSRGNLDEAVLELLEQARHPLCASTIAFLLDRPTRDICMTLNRLQKYGEVGLAKVTSRRLQFWELKRPR